MQSRNEGGVQYFHGLNKYGKMFLFLCFIPNPIFHLSSHSSSLCPYSRSLSFLLYFYFSFSVLPFVLCTFIPSRLASSLSFLSLCFSSLQFFPFFFVFFPSSSFFITLFLPCVLTFSLPPSCPVSPIPFLHVLVFPFFHLSVHLSVLPQFL